MLYILLSYFQKGNYNRAYFETEHLGLCELWSICILCSSYLFEKSIQVLFVPV